MIIILIVFSQDKHFLYCLRTNMSIFLIVYSPHTLFSFWFMTSTDYFPYCDHFPYRLLSKMIMFFVVYSLKCFFPLLMLKNDYFPYCWLPKMIVFLFVYCPKLWFPLFLITKNWLNIIIFLFACGPNRIYSLLFTAENDYFSYAHYQKLQKQLFSLLQKWLFSLLYTTKHNYFPYVLFMAKTDYFPYCLWPKIISFITAYGQKI